MDVLSKEKFATLFKEYKGHNGSVYTLAYDEEKDELYSAGGDGWIVKWQGAGEENDGYLVADTKATIFSMMILDDNKTIVAGDMYGRIFWIDLEDKVVKAESYNHTKGVFGFYQVSPTHLISISRDGTTILWNTVLCLAELTIVVNHQGLRSILPSIDNNTLYLGGTDHHIYELSLIDYSVKKIIAAAHENTVFAMLWNQKKQLITGGRDAHLKMWDMNETPQLIADIAAHWYTINDIVHLKPLPIIATASRDKTIRLWHEDTLAPIQLLDFQHKGHINSVNQLQWLVPHHILASASDDRLIKLWRIG